MSAETQRLGIVGGGQLARMMAAAGKRIGIECSFLVENEGAAEAVQGFGDIVCIEAGESSESLYKRLGSPKHITIDKEDVPGGLLLGLAEHCTVSPNCDALKVLCDKGAEKLLLREVGIPTVDFGIADTAATVAAEINRVGLPVVVKATTSGYDGKNQWVLRSSDDVEQFLPNYQDIPVVVEKFIPFDTEVSLIGARSAAGEISCYPMAENDHHKGVLVKSVAPAPAHLQSLLPRAKACLETLFERLDYIGIMSIEFFVYGEDLLINEIAPRVHNSGHWTMDADVCDQFENHLRAVFGMPLGNTKTTSPVAMLNFLGEVPNVDTATLNGAVMHDYGKTPRPGRKVGHVNVGATDYEGLDLKLVELQKTLKLD